jgi:hypothetical protein
MTEVMMTRQEFELWKAETNRSTYKWIIDLIHNGKDGRDLLIFKGGESGDYILVDPTGKVQVGTYTGAIPHICEAEFKVVGNNQCKDFQDGCTRILKSLGAEFLLEFIGIRL